MSNLNKLRDFYPDETPLIKMLKSGELKPISQEEAAKMTRRYKSTHKKGNIGGWLIIGTTPDNEYVMRNPDGQTIIIERRQLN